MTLKNNRAPRYATSSFVHHFVAIGEFKLELQSGNAQFGSKSTIFFSRVTLQFDIWPWKTKGYLFYATSSFVQHFVAIDEFKLELQSGNAQFGSNSKIFIAVWPWNLTDDLENNRAPLQCYFKLCASFRSHWWIQTEVTARKGPIWVKFDDFLEPCDLDIWRMTLKNNRAPLLSNIKLYASFHYHMWIQTGVTVRKRLSRVVTSVTLTFCMDITFVIGNNSWKFGDDTMMGT